MSQRFQDEESLSNKEVAESQSNHSSQEYGSEKGDGIKDHALAAVESKERLTTDDGFKFNQGDIMAILMDDDAHLPSLTLRMWVMAICLAAFVAGVDSFFNMRFPTIGIGVVVIQVIAWPIGRLWYMIIPQWTVPLPFGLSFSLNPGPFNYKEHTCIFVFCNVVISAGLVNNLVIEDTKFFKKNIGIPRQILFNITCYLHSVSLVGLCRDIITTPAERVWPGVLSNIALFKSIYSRDNPVVHGWKMPRWIFFIIVFLCSFVYYWFPDLIFPFFSNIGAWISWIRPDSAALSQVFGVKTGLGLFPFTLDWTQITSINNPLTTPFFAVASMFFSFVFWIWIVMPGLYYQNHWETAHMPIMSNSVFDKNGKQYNFTRIVDSDWNLDKAKFDEYSQAFMPVAFLMSLALGIAVFAALVTHTILKFPSEIWGPWANRGKQDDIFNKAVRQYKEFPKWIYLVFLVISLGLGFAFSEGWDDSPIDAGGYFVSVLIGTIMFVPLSLLEARANTNISLASFFEIVSANWYKGNAYNLLYFYTFGFSIIQHAMHMAQGAKMAHYMRIPPKNVMFLLACSGIWASLVSPSVTGYLLHHIKDICTDNAKNNMVCRKQKTSFNSHTMWGLFGSEIFVPGGRYGWVLWFFLVGALVPIAHFFWCKFRPNTWVRRFDPILFFGGAAMIPGVTGYNFSTWFVTAAIFNYFIHRRYTSWWRKYNLVSSIALDSGVAIAAILIYFCVVYTGGSKNYKWWGTTVAKKGCDAKGCPHLSKKIPPQTKYDF
ncbi:OPT family small oligopeptide transporter [Candidozyma auris]|nr:OPT family small oligopeptide transporter [[Candida] auris]QEL60951.1 OPT family small oligopeptide transporter [[Candida] auris]